MKVWVYRSRNGNNGVFTGDHYGWIKARQEQDDDNRCTVDDAIEEGWDVSGSEEEGRFSIDDGGEIELFEVK